MKKNLFPRVPWHQIAGIGFILIFIVLIAIRLNILEKFMIHKPEVESSAINAMPISEIWMDISQKGRKIGYAYRRFIDTDRGYKLSETVFMRINTMGTIQDIHFTTEGSLNRNLQLEDFNFNLRSSLFSFRLRGLVDERQLTIFTGEPGFEKRHDMTLQEKPYLSSGILETAVKSGLRPGQSRIFHIFDPATMGQRPVKVTATGYQDIMIMGRLQRARKMAVDFMGAQQYAWIGQEGDVLREEGIMGIILERVTKEQALAGMAKAGSADLTEIVSIDAGRDIENPAALKQLIVRVDGPYEGLFLNGGRQSLNGNVLIVDEESFPERGKRASSSDDAPRRFLDPTPLIQSDHPLLKKKVSAIISSDDPGDVKAQKLVDWVYKNIEKRPVLSVPNALDTLNNRQGDCNEHAMLLAALARAAGIPAQIETGLVYQRGRFYYHAWNVLYLGNWVTADAVFGQLPADVTHIRLIRGEAEQQIDLVQVIGRLKLVILKTS